MAHKLDKLKFPKYVRSHLMGENYRNSLAKHCKVNKVKEELWLHEYNWLFLVLQEALSYSFWAYNMTMTRGSLQWSQDQRHSDFKRGYSVPTKTIFHLLVTSSSSSSNQLLTQNTFQLTHTHTHTSPIQDQSSNPVCVSTVEAKLLTILSELLWASIKPVSGILHISLWW